MRANHQDTWVPVDGLAKPIRVLRGQFITGRFAMFKALYPKKKKTNPAPITTWRWLQTLRDMSNLSLEMNNKYTLVTICNYENYQSRNGENDQANDQQVISRRSAGDQQVITDKNGKKDENGNNGKNNIPAGFARWWAAWPKHFRKQAKGKCRDKWAAAGLELQADHVVAVVEAMKLTPDWTSPEMRGPPAPLVFLNQKRYECDVADLAVPETARQRIERTAAELKAQAAEETPHATN